MWQAPVEGLQAGVSAQALRLEADTMLDAATAARLQRQGAISPGFLGPVALAVDALLGVASVEYAANELVLAAEYSRWQVDIDASVRAFAPDDRTVSERAYVLSTYRVTPWFVPGLYYSVLFTDINRREGHDMYQHDVAGTLRFDVNDNWIVKLEGHYLNGTAALRSSDNGNRPLSELSPDWGLFLIKTTAYF
jgi:hypothetical protein